MGRTSPGQNRKTFFALREAFEAAAGGGAELGRRG
jgi:hypothetical protein